MRTWIFNSYNYIIGKVICYSFTTTKNNSLSQSQWINNKSSYVFLGKNHNERFALFRSTKTWPTVYYFIQWRNWSDDHRKSIGNHNFLQKLRLKFETIVFQERNIFCWHLGDETNKIIMSLVLSNIWTWRNTIRHSCHILNLPNSRTLLFKLQRHL